MVPLKYLSNFWRALETSIISCKLNLLINWYKESFISSIALATQVTTLALTDTKLCSSRSSIKSRQYKAI